MTHFVFVHGTGVREQSYQSTFKEIRSGLADAFGQVELHACFWGGTQGARLNDEGRSIPTYVDAGGMAANAPVDPQLAIWAILYVDPTYELRLLGTRPPPEGIAFGVSPAQAFEQAMRGFQPSSDLADDLERLGLSDDYRAACQDILSSEPFAAAVKTVRSPSHEHVHAYVRACIAGTISRHTAAGGNAPSGAARDALKERILNEMDSHGYALEWLKDAVLGFAKSQVTKSVRNNRGNVTDSASPAAGDILLYQARGEGVRSYIRQAVEEVGEPVHVIAHSLGGIACVDLLAGAELTGVASLTTMGSQAPFLYEINALYSLPFGAPLPDHFPAWLNFYDLNDFLSYPGNQIFRGRVRDVEVNNDQPFPESHSAYWANGKVWQRYREFVDAL